MVVILKGARRDAEGHPLLIHQALRPKSLRGMRLEVVMPILEEVGVHKSLGGKVILSLPCEMTMVLTLSSLLAPTSFSPKSF